MKASKPLTAAEVRAVPKLTKKQWEVLGRMEAGETLTAYIGWELNGRHADASACQRLAFVGFVTEAASAVITLRIPWELSPAGRAALAARRAEMERKGAK